MHELEHLFTVIPCGELQVICTVKKHILTGGPKRLPFTVPPLVFSCLKVGSAYPTHATNGFLLYLILTSCKLSKLLL